VIPGLWASRVRSARIDDSVNAWIVTFLPTPQNSQRFASPLANGKPFFYIILQTMARLVLHLQSVMPVACENGPNLQSHLMEMGSSMPPKLRRQTRQMRGFSLLEILVVVAVILIVTGITVPIVNRSVMVYRLTDAASQVNSNIKMARFEAIRKDALVNWQITKAGNTTTMFVDADRDAVFDAAVRAVILNTNVNVVAAAGVPNTAGLAAGVGVGALTAVNPANTAITFDARGSVTGVPVAYAVYLSDTPNGGATANYRAVVLLPSGIMQLWMAASDGAWRQLN
jgi:prepilin-type N-terminal cleavage/methylation domain-containing protein